jgi:paraquat-inducible protein A
LDSRTPAALVACPDCDLLQNIPPLAPGRRAACLRCHCLLARSPSGSVDLPLALTITAAIALVIANTLPLMSLQVVGRFADTTIPGGAYEMWMQGQRLVSVLVAFCAVIAPAVYVLFMLVLLIAARRTPVPHWCGEMLRWVGHLQVWSMLEVVMLGVLVALTKIAQMASVDPGIGMYGFGAAILLIPAIMTNFDKRELWQRVEWGDSGVTRSAPAMPSAPAPQ